MRTDLWLWTGLVFACVLSGASGCNRRPAGPPGPATVPVEGKVVFARGGDVKSLYNKQGTIEFESVDQADVKAYGAIQEDGSFKLASVNASGGTSEGAVQGAHR